VSVHFARIEALHEAQPRGETRSRSVVRVKGATIAPAGIRRAWRNLRSRRAPEKSKPLADAIHEALTAEARGTCGERNSTEKLRTPCDGSVSHPRPPHLALGRRARLWQLWQRRWRRSRAGSLRAPEEEKNVRVEYCYLRGQGSLAGWPPQVEGSAERQRVDRRRRRRVS
jgi:hypothetical protein